MTRKYFGTDGVRGRVGEPPITPEFVLKLGWAAGRVLANGHRGKVLIGKDTRISGYLLESALEAGLSAAGMDIRLLGPLPTPAIAYLTRTLHADAGIVISASHNPYYDNGIKFFSGRGAKLPDEVEKAIEAMMDEPLQTLDSAHLGKAERIADARGRYIEFCKSTFPGRGDLAGLRLVVDCAHGATYQVAPAVFRELGAEVEAIGVEPDGFNINEGCGSTDPERLAAAVRERGADAGIALDGDGDRVIMVDHTGEHVDGDELLYIIAQGDERPEGVVGTLMSNLGLEQALGRDGIAFERAAVGDRYVLERLQARGWRLGGESSGHILCLDRTTTGDGIVSALQVLGAMVATGRPLRELKRRMSKYPQTLINVRLERPGDPTRLAAVQAAVQDVERALGEHGRVLLRPSGTEPVVRVMVEGADADHIEALARQLAAAVADAVRAEAV